MELVRVSETFFPRAKLLLSLFPRVSPIVPPTPNKFSEPPTELLEFVPFVCDFVSLVPSVLDLPSVRVCPSVSVVPCVSVTPSVLVFDIFVPV